MLGVLPSLPSIFIGTKADCHFFVQLFTGIIQQASYLHMKKLGMLTFD